MSRKSATQEREERRSIYVPWIRTKQNCPQLLKIEHIHCSDSMISIFVSTICNHAHSWHNTWECWHDTFVCNINSCSPVTCDLWHSFQMLRLDITPMAPPPPSSGSATLDPARIVSFSPQALNQLLVVTAGARLIKFSASNGQLLSEVSNIHRGECTSLAVDRTGRYLLTTGDRVVKVWDYSMALDLNFQVRAFITNVC